MADKEKKERKDKIRRRKRRSIMKDDARDDVK